jgi:predicted GNAT family acetyltransferase
MRLQRNSKEDRPPGAAPVTATLRVSKLTRAEESEVVSFLSRRPGRTFGMLGFIRSNGLVSPHNRGTFYACRDDEGRLEGVALIGHHILLDAKSEDALTAFVRLAQRCSAAYMLLGVPEDVQTFWRHYADGGAAARLVCRERLFEQRRPLAELPPVTGLRLAAFDDLDLIVPVHARLVMEESGEDPLQSDAEAFRRRCRRRIGQRQTWVWIEDGRLIFKIDVVSDTPEIVYLEGVWVDPAERRKGYGARCLSQLTRTFLGRSRAVCVLVNENQPAAHDFYSRAGFKPVGVYDTIFLEQKIC